MEKYSEAEKERDKGSRIERTALFLGLTFLLIFGEINEFDFRNSYFLLIVGLGYLWIFGGWIMCFLLWFERDKLSKKEEDLLLEKIYKTRSERIRIDTETEMIKSRTRKKPDKKQQ